MLDPSSPMSQHIFAAGRLEGALIVRAKLMTLAPSRERAVLLAESLPFLREMKALNDAHFHKATIPTAVDEVEEALRKLADLRGGRIEHGAAAGEPCPGCDGEIIHFQPNKYRPEHWDTYCNACVRPFFVPISRLRSGECFGTDFI